MRPPPKPEAPRLDTEIVRVANDPARSRPDVVGSGPFWYCAKAPAETSSALAITASLANRNFMSCLQSDDVVSPVATPVRSLGTPGVVAGGRIVPKKK